LKNITFAKGFAHDAEQTWQARTYKGQK